MRWWERWRRRTRVERQLDAELRFHVEQQVADLTAAGLSEAEARRRVRMTFGGVEQVKDACRDVRRTRLIDTTLQDARYAWRSLRAQPAFTLVVVLSLALGIGANTAAYTLLHAALLRALPLPQPQRLVQLTAYDGSGDQPSHFAYVLYQQFREALRPHADTIAMQDQSLERVRIDDGALEPVVIEGVSANYFGTLGVGASEGRLIVESDAAVVRGSLNATTASDVSLSGGQAVAVISHAYRTRRFSDDEPVVGRTLTVDDRRYVIVGVTAAGFYGLEAQSRTDVWVPVTARLPAHWLASHGSMVLRVMARLRGDESAAATGLDAEAHRTQAGAKADVVFRRFLAEHVLARMPEVVRRQFELRHLRLRPAEAGLATIGLTYRRPLLILMGTVAIILGLCCANVANLLLARQRARQQEFAVRLSLGAGPGRLARQLLTESLLLGVIGALFGLLLAHAGSRALVRLLPEDRIPLTLDLTPDAGVLTFTVAITLLSALLVGLVPAWRAARTDAGLSLSQHTRTVLRARVNRTLVVAQLAGSLVLLITALLMARTLQNLRLADLGFRPQQVHAFDLSFPRTVTAPTRTALYQRISERLSAASGVTGVTTSREPVYSTGGWEGGASVRGQRESTPDRRIALLRVGPRFFDTLGITVTAGRAFDRSDHQAARRTVMLNETAARYFFGESAPIGRHLEMNGRIEYEVVGVVKDVLHYGAREQPSGGRVGYFADDAAAPGGAFFVRGTLPPADIQRLVREELRQAGDEVQLERLRPLETDVADMVARERMVGWLAAGFGLLALAIAAVGLYGVLAYGVSQRTSEIGLRAALGAAPAALRRMVLRDALLLVAAGLVIGLPLALAAVRLLGSLLFGISPDDTVTLVLAVLVLIGTATVAAWLPARRAAAIDPATALRST